MRARLAALIFLAPVVCAQDVDWVRDWERAQRERPAAIGSVGRIAPKGERGTPMVVHGRIEPPTAGVIVFAYQTDAGGVYHEPGARGWRLRGWARSDAQGRFELHTIRPGPYPGTRAAAHIHVTIEGPGLPRRWSDEIQFADDPLVRNQSDASAVTVRNGTQHVNYTIRIEDRGRF